MEKYAAREWRARLRKLLNTVCDPIGVGSMGGPEDEYDAYNGKIAALVGSGASDDELREYLRWAQIEPMKLGEAHVPTDSWRVTAATRRLTLRKHSRG